MHTTQACPTCGQPIGITGLAAAQMLGVSTITLYKAASRLVAYTEVREGPHRTRRRYTPEHIEQLRAEFSRVRPGPKLKPTPAPNVKCPAQIYFRPG